MSAEDPNAVDESGIMRQITDRLRKDPNVDLPRDVVHDLLKNERRRIVIEIVDAWQTVTLKEVAAKVAARELGKPEELVNSKERKRVYTALYQSHLEKMADAGAVQYDRPSGRIEASEHTEDLNEIANRVDEWTE